MKKQHLFGAFMALSSLVGCSNNTPEVTQTTNNEYVSPLPADAPVVKVVTSSTVPPFAMRDGYGNLQGIDVDVIRAVGEKEGFKVEIHDEPFANMLPAIEQGKYQVAVGVLSYTPERASKYGYTNPYLYSPSVVLYRSDLTLNHTTELTPLRTAVLPDTKQYDLAHKLGIKSIDVQKSTFSMIQGVLQNKYDAILDDKIFMEYVLANHSEHRDKFKFLEYEDASEPSSQLVFYTHQNNEELINKLNSGIAKLKAEGKIEQITNSYLKQSFAQ